ncbi:MAG: hypothetical protein EOO38_18750 [Cytophagaceae bacterium]|nr:MAG: hypothetical protein EOO38_18750 [Cytophagaceae bacterium]
MERCDPSASCNQDGQTFKGIFFHHLTAFCDPLPRSAVRAGATYAADSQLAHSHRKQCEGYTDWVVHNARAAMRTRDEKGRFGSWWGAPFGSEFVEEWEVPGAIGAVDYRNERAKMVVLDIVPEGDSFTEPKLRGEGGKIRSGDLNDRGRGRTVETQGAGLSVVRAMVEFLRRREGNEESAAEAEVV